MCSFFFHENMSLQLMDVNKVTPEEEIKWNNPNTEELY